ncbi:MAG: glycosyltransferase family 39 protein [Nanoarchaeota archaeon]
MKLSQFAGIMAVILTFLILKLFLTGFSSALWWDSAVYIGMGKSIFSNGSIGFFEDARPLALPLILGFLWWIGLDIVWFGSIMMLIFSVASILLTYLIARRVFGNFPGLVAALMLATYPPFIAYSTIINADLPGGFFILTSIYLLLRQKNTFAGFFLALAILTKFTSIVAVPAILFCMLLSQENVFKKLANFFLGFLMLLLPYSIFSLISYGDLIAPLIKAHNLITNVAGNFSCPTSPGFYLASIAGGSILSALFFVGIIKKPFSYLRKKEWKSTLILLIGLAPFIYLTFFLNCKDARYSLLFIPYTFMFSSLGLHKILKRIKGKNIKIAILVFAFLLQITVSTKILSSEYKWLDYNDKNEAFYKFMHGKSIKGKIWSSDPFVSAFHDVKTDELMYYPVLDNNKIDHLLSSINSEVEYIFINTCDIQCVSGSYCESGKEELFDLLRSKFFVYKYEKYNGCERLAFIWKR